MIDDFTASGSSLLRLQAESQAWEGKLCRFFSSVRAANCALGSDYVFDQNWQLCVHHYIATTHAKETIADRLVQAVQFFGHDCAKQIIPSFGMVFPAELPIDRSLDSEFAKLTDIYYDPILRTDHTDIGGVTHLGLGFAGCALPVVLEHNTPNNSVALLWADTEGGIRNGETAPAMRPLFRRRHRHS